MVQIHSGDSWLHRMGIGNERRMNVTRLGSDSQRATDPIFDGDASIHVAVTDEQSDSVRVSLVRFANGCRTKWHRHTYDQVLVAMEGEGIVADESEQHALREGELILVPKESVHWHGARPGHDFAHLVMFSPGETFIVRDHAPVSSAASDIEPRPTQVPRS
jgi:quercetin dioxygenase-like cupin family protein